MKKTKKLILPTAAENSAINAGTAADADTFEISASMLKGMRKLGRPEIESPKQSVTLRMDADLLASLRSTGKGWQTRVNQVLSDAVKQGKLSAPSKSPPSAGFFCACAACRSAPTAQGLPC